MDVECTITPWACLDEDSIQVDSGKRLSFKVQTNRLRGIEVGCLVLVEGFNSKGFSDGYAEFVRKDYLGENVSRIAFYRVGIKS